MNKKVLLSLVMASTIGSTGMYAANAPMQAPEGAQEVTGEEESSEATIEAAYQADKMLLEEVLHMYTQVTEAISANYSEYRNEAEEARLFQRIKELISACDAAYKQAQESGSYDFEFTEDDAMDLQMQIMAMYYRASNPVAYEAVQKTGAKLLEDLQNADKAIFESCGEDIYNNEDVRALYVAASDKIQAIGDAMDVAFDEAQENGTEFIFMISEADEAGVDVAISAMTKKANDLRVAENDAAYGIDMTWLKEAQETLTAKWEEIGKLYPYYYASEEGENYAKDIYDLLAEKFEAVDAENEVVAETGLYKSPITDKFKAEIQSGIDGMQKDANKFNYTKVKAAIDALADQLEEATSEDQPYYDQIDKGLSKSISNQIEALQQKAEDAYKATNDDQVFDPDYSSEISTISAAIQTLVKNAQDAQAGVDEANRVQSNNDAYDAVIEELDDLKTFLDEQTNGQDYSVYVNWGRVEGIESQIEELREKAADELAAVEKEGKFDLDIADEVDNIYSQIADIVLKAKQAQLKADNQAAYEAVIDQIDALQDEFDYVTSEKRDWYPYIYEMQKNAIQKVIDTIREDTNNALDRAQASGYKFTFDPSERIETAYGAIEEMRDQAFNDFNTNRIAENNKAANNDERQLNVIRESFELMITALDEQFPGWSEDEACAEYEAKRVAIDEELNDVAARIKAALDEVAEEGIYMSPMTDVAWQDLEDEIAELRYNVEMQMTYGDREEYNKDAYGVDKNLLTELQELLSNAYNEIVAEYPDFEKFGSAIALHTNLYDDLAAMDAAAEAAYEAVEKEGIYGPVIPDNFEQEILDGIEELKALGEQFGATWHEWQDDANEALALSDEFWPFLDELDAINEDWMEIAEANALYEELDAELSDMLNGPNNAWNAYLKTGEYIAPFDEADIEAFKAKLQKLKDMVSGTQTGVGAVVFDAEAEYYTLDGQKLSRPVRGMINIVRTGDKIQKIFVK